MLKFLGCTLKCRFKLAVSEQYSLIEGSTKK